MIQVTTRTPSDPTAGGRRTEGAVVAVVGPDGAGKTTLSEGLVAQGIAGRPVLRFHSRPPMLPRRSANEVVDRPHGRPPFGRFISIAKLSYLYVDYVLGWFMRVRPFVKRGGFVVLERGWWDIVVDPARYRLNVPHGLAAGFGHFLPAADLVLVLEAPSDVLIDRKAELPANELARQAKAWRELPKSNSTCIYLDASLAPRDVAESASREVRRVLGF